MHFTSIRPSMQGLRFGQDVGIKDAAWAEQRLLQVCGVPSDLLGTPKLKDEHIARMSAIIGQLSDAERLVLKSKAERKELSDWRQRDRILPETHERKLLELLNDLL